MITAEHREDKIMTIEELHDFNIANEEIKIMKDYLYFGPTFNPNGNYTKKSKEDNDWEGHLWRK